LQFSLKGIQASVLRVDRLSSNATLGKSPYFTSQVAYAKVKRAPHDSQALCPNMVWDRRVSDSRRYFTMPSTQQDSPAPVLVLRISIGAVYTFLEKVDL
jgi:hypothetical protein